LRPKKRDFLLIYHERLYILGRPMGDSKYEGNKYGSCIEL